MKSIAIFLSAVLLFAFVSFKLGKLVYGWQPVTITQPDGQSYDGKMYEIGWIVK